MQDEDRPKHPVVFVMFYEFAKKESNALEIEAQRQAFTLSILIYALIPASQL